MLVEKVVNLVILLIQEVILNVSLPKRITPRRISRVLKRKGFLSFFGNNHSFLKEKHAVYI
jgi:hypothetical protein